MEIDVRKVVCEEGDHVVEWQLVECHLVASVRVM